MSNQIIKKFLAENGEPDPGNPTPTWTIGGWTVQKLDAESGVGKEYTCRRGSIHLFTITPEGTVNWGLLPDPLTIHFTRCLDGSVNEEARDEAPNHDTYEGTMVEWLKEHLLET